MKLREVIERDMNNMAREIGEGVCVDCGGNSKKYYRCFGCNKRYSLRKKQKEKEKEDLMKETDFLMITRAKLCKENGEKCKNIICPNCKPMDGDDGPINLEFLQKKYNLI